MNDLCFRGVAAGRSPDGKEYLVPCSPDHLFAKDVWMMNNAGLWIGLVILAFAGTFFYQGLGYDFYSKYGPGPGLFPLWLSGSLLVLTVLYIVDSVRKSGISVRDILPKGSGLKNVATVFASLLAFLVVMPLAGYTVASVIMLFILFHREYKWYSGLGISIAVSLAIFYLFKSFLGIPLPMNTFGF